MFVLIGFAFLAGVITILSPCILPILPIVLSGTTIGSKKYPFGVVVGFIVSFSFFTLFLTTIVNWLGISADILRYVSVIVILLFGLILVVPKLQLYYEIFVSKLSASKTTSNDEKKKTGFIGGFLIGISLGLVWTPCVGPILASVIALALSGSVSGSAVAVTFSYATGTAIPMLIVMYGGRAIFNRVPWLLEKLQAIQRVFGALLIIVAVAIFFNFDRQFQIFILEKFPQYGTGLVKIEDNEQVKNALDETFSQEEGADPSIIGKPMPLPGQDQIYPVAPEIVSTGEWFNSAPLTISGLQGKVVLIDFWTYSCINCIRTLPYIEDWYEKYRDDGLVVIGVHTPEFEFEKNPDNLAKAIQDFGLTYPIVQDNDYKTWRAYNNRYWPAKYFIDAEGRLRDSHFGEGDYDESEELIQSLLKEASGKNIDITIDNPEYDIESGTPETYLGYARIQAFGSPEGVQSDVEAEYSIPEKLGDNYFAYGGRWTVKGEMAEASADAALRLNFRARKVFLVMNPLDPNLPATVEVYLDGNIIDADAGDDVQSGLVTVDSDRLYNLVSLGAAGRHLLELKFPNGNVSVFAFTFG